MTRRSLIERAQSKRSRSSARGARPLPRSLLSKTASLPPGVYSLTSCTVVSQPVASRQMGIPAIQSDMEQLLGQLPTAQTMQPSRVLGADAATAFDAMLISQLLIKLRPQRQLSTQMPTNLLTSPPPPGGISDLSTCPSCVGLPLASLQPQLTTISPSGTLLAL